jgi:hypothetical protein
VSATDDQRPRREPARRPVAPNTKDRGLLEVKASERSRATLPVDKSGEEYTLLSRRCPPLPSYTGLVEQAQAGKIGIACSGGGIRSAAFSLGALQVLQQERKLQQATYLAGVSGGSYIAAAFNMVRRTWSRAEAQAARERAAEQGKPQTYPPARLDDPKLEAPVDDSDPDAVDARHPPFFPGSPEEQYLRNRSSYMAPGGFGLIQFGYRIVLGMLVNLMFVGFAVVSLAIPLGLLYGLVYPHLYEHVDGRHLCHPYVAGPHEKRALCEFVPLHVPTLAWVVPTAIVAGAVLVGMGSVFFYFLRAPRQEWLQIWTLRVLLAGLIIAFFFVALPQLLGLWRDLGAGGLPGKKGAPARNTTTATVAIGAGGTATLAGAILLELRAQWSKAKVVVGEVGKFQKAFMGLGQKARLAIAYGIAAVVGPGLTLLLAIEAMAILLNQQDRNLRFWAINAGIVVAFIGMAWLADMTSWSLHPFYRRRLCSAFALKRLARMRTPQGRRGRLRRLLSRLAGEGPDGAHRPDKLTPPIASDEAGVAIERAYADPALLSETAVAEEDGAEPWPTLLVCASANISDNSATPPGRAVTSFTFSATAVGGPLIGAERTDELERRTSRKLSPFTLPAAVAMSGAALSPSMGKETRWPLRYLMALANIRLGVWVPNPRKIEMYTGQQREATDETRRSRLRFVRNGPRRRRHYPRPRSFRLLFELLGWNTIDATHLYVTDGGHYENLGLVELLRRGCSEVYVFDASNDDFGAIGDAVTLARSELEVNVNVDCTTLDPDKTTGLSSADCVEGTIRFRDVDSGGEKPLEGELYYARLTLTATSPTDARAYARKDTRFPHDPTSDQLYTDQRFEAYRSLGAQAARNALALHRARHAQKQAAARRAGCLPGLRGRSKSG